MSGLTSAMWTGVSGLLTHSKKMNVVGNNLANVSTIGFKAQRMDFNDYLYTEGASASGPTQIGAGTGVYALLGDFSQGTFEATNMGTDLAIDGKGFFGVRQNNADAVFYTRAGDFYFNEKRELVTPTGYFVQGWKVNESSSTIGIREAGAPSSIGNESSSISTSGAPRDIVLDQWNIVPKKTSSVKMIMGLQNKATGGANNATQMFQSWNATATPPLADDQYLTQSTLKVYDESGLSHNLTTYYNQLDPDNALNGLPAGYKAYEYLVTCDPADDKRAAFAEGTAGENARGKLMSGVLVFDTAGRLVQQSAYTYNGDAAGDPTDAATWTTTAISSNGLPVLAVNFIGADDVDTVFQPGTRDINTGTPLADTHMVEINFGLISTGGDAVNANTDWVTDPFGTPADGLTNTLDQATDYGNTAFMINAERTVDATVANQERSSTVQDTMQNGYATGLLSNYNISTDGVVYGVYSNGENIPLYQITLYDFHNYQGLRREGGNLYSKTQDSGEPRIGTAGDNGFGTTNAYQIESSNVDMATELVQMITCQRGFQSNTKIVMTTDTMLEQTINMKR